MSTWGGWLSRVADTVVETFYGGGVEVISDEPKVEAANVDRMVKNHGGVPEAGKATNPEELKNRIVTTKDEENPSFIWRAFGWLGSQLEESYRQAQACKEKVIELVDALKRSPLENVEVGSEYELAFRALLAYYPVIVEGNLSPHELLELCKKCDEQLKKLEEWGLSDDIKEKLSELNRQSLTLLRISDIDSSFYTPLQEAQMRLGNQSLLAKEASELVTDLVTGRIHIPFTKEEFEELVTDYNQILHLAQDSAKEGEILALCKKCDATLEKWEKGVLPVDIRGDLHKMNESTILALKQSAVKETAYEPLVKAQEMLGKSSLKEVGSALATGNIDFAVGALQESAAELAFGEGDLKEFEKLMDPENLFNYLFGGGGEKAHLAEVVARLGLRIPPAALWGLVKYYNLKKLIKDYWTKEIALEGTKYAKALQKLKETEQSLPSTPGESRELIYQRRAAFLFKELGLDKVVDQWINPENILTEAYGFESYGANAEHTASLDGTLKYWGVPDILLKPLQEGLSSILKPEVMDVWATKTLQDLSRLLEAIQKLKEFEEAGGFPVTEEERDILSQLSHQELRPDERTALLKRYDNIQALKRADFLYRELGLGEPGASKGGKPFYIEKFAKQWSTSFTNMLFPAIQTKKGEKPLKEIGNLLFPIQSAVDLVTNNVKEGIHTVISDQMNRLLGSLGEMAITGSALQGEETSMGSYTSLDETGAVISNVADFATWFLATQAISHIAEAQSGTLPKEAPQPDKEINSILDGAVNLSISAPKEGDSMGKKGVRALIERGVTLLKQSINGKGVIDEVSSKFLNWIKKPSPLQANLNEINSLKNKSNKRAGDHQRLGQLYLERVELVELEKNRKILPKLHKAAQEFLDFAVEYYRKASAYTGLEATYRPPTQKEYQKLAIEHFKEAYELGKTAAQEQNLIDAYLAVYKTPPEWKNAAVEITKLIGRVPIEFQKNPIISDYEKDKGAAALIALAKDYEMRGNTDFARDHYLMAYLNFPNNAESAYEFGRFLEKHPEEVSEEITFIKAYEKAAELGHEKAQVAYGRLMLDQGKGDPNLAVQFLRSAGKKSNGEAFMLLGRCYIEGKGVAKYPPYATYYFETAKKCGYQGQFPSIPEPSKLLADVLKSAQEAKNPDTKARLYIEAGKMGYAKGYIEAANLQTDREEAIKLMRKAAHMGDKDAIKNMIDYHASKLQFDIAIKWAHKEKTLKGPLQDLIKNEVRITEANRQKYLKELVST